MSDHKPEGPDLREQLSPEGRAEFDAGCRDEEFAGRIMELVYGARQKAGLTQQELADRVGVSADDIDDIESGTPPTTELLRHIAEACNAAVTIEFV